MGLQTRALIPVLLVLFVALALVAPPAGSVPPPAGTAAPATTPAGGPGAAAQGVDWEAAYHHNNLGVAHMEQHRYGRAAEEFRQAVALAPAWNVAYENLGIALYSAHDDTGAETAFRKALELEPRAAHALYCLGLIHKLRGQREEAVTAFNKVAEIDPRDADTLYNLGLLYQWNGEWEKSIGYLEQASGLDPTNISAIYKLATALLNAGKTQEGQAMMERFRKMNADPAMGTTRGQQYGEQGRYAEVMTEAPAKTVGSQSAPPASQVRFVDVSQEAGLRFRHLGPGGGAGGVLDDPRQAGSGVAIGDVDGDGDLDLCFAEVGGARGPALRLYLNDGKAKFADGTEPAGLSTTGIGMACYLGDIDNDGDVDLFLSAAQGGASRLFRNQGGGRFVDITRAAGLAEAGPGAGAAFADVDHDGDLDLYAAGWPGAPAGGSGAGPAAAANRLWLNRGDGTLLDATSEEGLGGRGRGSRGLAFSDLDSDRDIDFILLDGAGSPQLFSNLRGGKWEEIAAGRGLGGVSGAGSVAFADFNKDGFMDLALPGAGASLLWLNDGGRRFSSLRQTDDASAGASGAVFLDYDNDGFVDALVTGSGRDPARLLRNTGGWSAGGGSGFAPGPDLGVPPAQLRSLRGAAAGDLDGDGDLDLVLTRNGASPLLLRNDGGNARHWLKVRTVGLHSTRQGIGTKVEVQAGGLWQKAEVNGGSGYLSQGPPEVIFGLGERAGAEFVRLLWPGGVLQSELEIASNRLLAVEELDRKGSSCPVLYAWDGSRFSFVNDFLGGGGIGFLVAPGRYTHPDPDEYVKVSGDLLRERDGWLELRAVQQLEEVAYLDQVELVIVDHPAGTDIFPNERFMTAAPYPGFEVYEVRERVFPVSARDARGRDRTAALREADRIYADGFDLLPWPGYAEPHELVLEFGPEAAGERWKLFLNGWVDYGYSYANYAAAQAGASLWPPRLERVAPGGGWEVVAGNLGYPAGLSRTMVGAAEVSWTGQDRRLRVSTNMRVFWDQVFLARPRRLPERRLPRLPVAQAELRFLGFPREYSPDGRRPFLYDYSLAASSFPWKNMRGRFTRYGDVRDLLRGRDDRFVIMNRGDEVTLRFDARQVAPLAQGWKRDYLLFADGYAKDMDPHGAFPDTVEPLPFHAMSGYPYPAGEHYPEDAPHRDYVTRWNTRSLWFD